MHIWDKREAKLCCRSDAAVSCTAVFPPDLPVCLLVWVMPDWISDTSRIKRMPRCSGYLVQAR